VRERKQARAEKRVEATGKKPRILPPRHEPRKGAETYSYWPRKAGS
jgi:hypothetical protein